MQFQNMQQRLEFIARYSTQDEYSKFLAQLRKTEDLDASASVINFWFSKIRYDVDMGVRS